MKRDIRATSIRVSYSLRMKLKKLKANGRESYDTVIRKLLK